MKDILMFSDHAWLGAVAIVIFVTVFIGALIWMLRPGAKQAYALRAQMPLSDDTPIEAWSSHPLGSPSPRKPQPSQKP